MKLYKVDNEVTQYLLKMEKYALMNISSPYLMKGIKVLENKHYCFMVTEFCNGGTLKEHIRANGAMNEQEAFSIMDNLLEGYADLLSQRILHRDLKPANIMLQDGTPKIIDFGYSAAEGFPKPSIDYNVGSPSYMAPESFKKNLYNEKTEVWAFGVILHELLTTKVLDNG